MPTETEELQLAPPQENEPPMKQLAPFSTLEQEARKMIASAETIAALPPTEVNAKVARTMRLEIRPLRTAVEKRYAELKRPIIDAGNALTEGRDALLDLLKPMEAKLLAIEQHAEREALRIEDGKREARAAEIAPFLTGPLSVDLGKMSDDEYAKVLADAKDLDALRKERTRKEAEAAAALAKAEAEERERIANENARLKKEAEEREAAAKAEREAALAREMALQEIQGIQQQTIIAITGRAGVRKGGTIECIEQTLEETKRWTIDEHFGALMPSAQKAKEVAIAEIETALDQKRADVAREKAAEEKAQREREEAARAAREEKAKADAALAAAQDKASQEAIAAQKAREEERAMFEAERKKERAEAEAKAKAVAEQATAEAARIKAVVDKERLARKKLEAEIATNKAAEEIAASERKEAEHAAAMAPEKEKLKALAKTVRELHIPVLKSAEGIAAVVEISAQVEKFAAYITKKAESL